MSIIIASSHLLCVHETKKKYKKNHFSSSLFLFFFENKEILQF